MDEKTTFADTGHRQGYSFFFSLFRLSIRSVRRTLLIVGKKVQYKLVYRLSIMHDFNIVRDGQRRRRRPVIPAQSSLEIGYHKG